VARVAPDLLRSWSNSSADQREMVNGVVEA
jgi:hypothetical protein